MSTTEPNDYWHGEIQTRVTAAETRLNALNGDLRHIREHMEWARKDLALVSQHVDDLRDAVNRVLNTIEARRSDEIHELRGRIESNRTRLRNVVLFVLVPVIIAVVTTAVTLVVH